MVNIIKLNLLPTIIITTILLVGIGVGFYHYSNEIKSLNITVSDKEKTNNALKDSVRYYIDKYNQEVAEKLTLQGTVKEITNKNNKLTASQKELMKRVNEVNEENIVIAAANIKLAVKIDSLESVMGVFNPANNSLNFSKTTLDVSYNITVSNVMEIINKRSMLQINNLSMLNKQLIEFHWDSNKKIDHPVSFTVINSNKYFRTADIDSYIIPEINKDKIKPTGWQKINNFIGKSGGKLAIFGTGVGVGSLAVFFLTK